MPAFARENPVPYSNIFIEALNSSLYFSSVANGSSTVAPEITYYLSGAFWDRLNAETAFKGALAGWSAVANITFRELEFPDSSLVWTETLYSQPNSGILGRHFLPNDDNLGGEFNRSHPIFTAASNLQGGLSYVTFLHEIGHGLGLQHPFEIPPFPGVDGGDPYDPGDFNFNNGIYTVMGYEDAPFFADPGTINYGYAGTPMAFDIAAIQAIYGANTTTAAGDTVYTLPTVNASGTFWSTIWDTGGNDTIRVGAGAVTGATIDLRAATLRVEPGGGGWESRVGGIFGGVLIANNVVIENAVGSGFVDTLRGNEAGNRLEGMSGNDLLYGEAGNDHLLGGDGDDRFYGGAGTDRLEGGAGADQYYIEQGDIIVESATTSGNDKVYLSFDGYLMAAHVETAILTTSMSPVSVTGNELGNTIIIEGSGTARATANGAGGNDILTGSAQADTLIGGAGIDSFTGGGGNDLFHLDAISEVVTELANQGFDTVRITQTGYSLADNIEQLFLDGSALNGFGNGLANILNGNAQANRMEGYLGEDFIYGFEGNDILSGGAGVDRLYGGLGDDIYNVDDINERIIELAGEGRDIIFSSVNFAIRDNVEQLTLIGNAIEGFGNAQANSLFGNALANVLRGQGGNDVLRGDAGNDNLYGGSGLDGYVGGTGADAFVFETNDFQGQTAQQFDIIYDFRQGDGDVIDLRRIDAITGGPDNRFTFIDTALFSGTAGELRYALRGAHTYVEGDLNGDGLADFTIRVDGVVDLAAADFLL